MNKMAKKKYTIQEVTGTPDFLVLFGHFIHCNQKEIYNPVYRIFQLWRKICSPNGIQKVSLKNISIKTTNQRRNSLSKMVQLPPIIPWGFITPGDGLTRMFGSVTTTCVATN